MPSSPDPSILRSPQHLALITSLLANVLLGAALWQATAVARDYHWRRLTARPVAIPSEPPATRLAPAPTQPPDYARAALADIRPALAYGGQRGPAFAAWRESGREGFAKLLAYAPTPPAGAPIVVERTVFPGVVREHLYWRSARGYWLNAYLLRPATRQGPGAAILALPGHDHRPVTGGRAVTGLDWPTNYMQAFGLRLAEAGYVVLAPDVSGIGELGDGYTAQLHSGWLAQKPLKGQMLADVHEATDLLLARPEVDPSRLGAVGLSLGGELALYAAVLDPRIRFVACSGFMGSLREASPQAAGDLFVPGLLTLADVPDLAGMVAPRPLLVQHGRQDRIAPYAPVEPAIARVRRAYAGAGAPQALTFQPHAGAHTLALPGLLEWLGTIAPPPGEAS